MAQKMSWRIGFEGFNPFNATVGSLRSWGRKSAMFGVSGSGQRDGQTDEAKRSSARTREEQELRGSSKQAKEARTSAS
jgi:hypothetical protein